MLKLAPAQGDFKRYFHGPGVNFRSCVLQKSRLYWSLNFTTSDQQDINQGVTMHPLSVEI
jgi:hypothetical protein